MKLRLEIETNDGKRLSADMTMATTVTRGGKKIDAIVEESPEYIYEHYEVILSALKEKLTNLKFLRGLK